MFCSKLFFVVVSLGAISVLASPHALHFPHQHRGVAARVRAAHNASSRAVSPRCQGPPGSSNDSTPTSPPLDVSASTTFPPSSKVFSGDGTYYGIGLGACGITNQEPDRIVAVSSAVFSGTGFNKSYGTANPNLNPICGKQIQATYNGTSVVVTIVDLCAGCPSKYDLDFSKSVFQQLASLDVGRLHGVVWHFL